MANNNLQWDKIQGNWKQFKGKIQEQWGRLTDDEILAMHGEREQLAGKIQEKYGMAKEDVNRQIDEWAESLKTR